MISKVRKKRKIFKINRKGGRLIFFRKGRRSSALGRSAILLERYRLLICICCPSVTCDKQDAFCVRVKSNIRSVCVRSTTCVLCACDKQHSFRVRAINDVFCVRAINDVFCVHAINDVFCVRAINDVFCVRAINAVFCVLASDKRRVLCAGDKRHVFCVRAINNIRSVCVR